jgi:hypothetical protein
MRGSSRVIFEIVNEPHDSKVAWAKSAIALLTVSSS